MRSLPCAWTMWSILFEKKKEEEEQQQSAKVYRNIYFILYLKYDSYTNNSLVEVLVYVLSIHKLSTHAPKLFLLSTGVFHMIIHNNHTIINTSVYILRGMFVPYFMFCLFVCLFNGSMKFISAIRKMNQNLLFCDSTITEIFSDCVLEGNIRSYIFIDI